MANKKPVLSEDIQKQSESLPHWIYLVLLAMGVIAVGSALFMATDPSLPAPVNALFPKSFTTPHVIAKEQMEDGLGWGSELTIDKKEGQPATIRFLLRGKDRKPISEANAQIIFTPLSTTPDIKTVTAPLNMDEPGVYRAIIDLPGPASWDVRTAIRVGKTAYQSTKRVNLP
jgi:FixH